MNKKGLNPLISSVVVMLIVAVSAMIVASVLGPVMKQGKESQTFNEAKQQMSTLDALANSLYYEAPGATRVIKMSINDGKLVIAGDENKIKYMIDAGTIEPTSVKEGKLTISSGPSLKAYEGDADGDGSADLIMENSNLLFAVRKYGNSTNYAGINISNAIPIIKNKKLGINIKPKTAIYINETSQAGNGFSQLSATGMDLTSAGIRLFMNASISYEAIFTLSSGADYVVFEVRQV